MTLDVIIPTVGKKGITKVSSMYLPAIRNVSYIIGWQEYSDTPIPESLNRADIKIFCNEGLGLSRNRNDCLCKSKADIVVFVDDDVELKLQGFKDIVTCFEKYPDTDVATFKTESSEHVRYPGGITLLTRKLPKNYNVKAIEIAFRRDLFPKFKFDERFGINSGRFASGEDELFHLKARKSGLVCRFFPVTIASHMHDSTGTGKIDDPMILQSMGVIILKTYPLSGILRIPIKALRLKIKSQAPFSKSLLNLYLGAAESFFIKL